MTPGSENSSLGSKPPYPPSDLAAEPAKSEHSALSIYRQMLLAAGVNKAMLDAIEGAPTQQQYLLLLTPYEAANLMQMVDAAYRFPHDKERVSEDTPIKRFNSGDWIGQLHWKLQAEVGKEYPVPPNPIYVAPQEAS